MISQRHLLQRIAPSLDGRWLLVPLAIGLVAGVVAYLSWDPAAPPLDLLALGPEGAFVDTLDVPAEWVDTATSTVDAPVRVPLLLGVRNRGSRVVRPERLNLSLPLRYRLTTAAGEELPAELDAGSPLVRYTLRPGLEPVEPGRLPALLPAYDTLWLEVLVPRFHCVALGDSIPEIVVASAPPVGPMSRVRLFYSFEGGDLSERRTGTLAVRLDSSLLEVSMPAPLPSFPMETNPLAARPDLSALAYAGSRRSRCGEPEDPLELLSSVWETPEGGRFIALDYGGAVRKHLYDLNGDGFIERESWDPDGDGTFEATRRARLPIPEFLLPRPSVTDYPLARFDSLSPDSLARLDPFRRAMAGPALLPALGDTAAFGRYGAGPPPDSLPAPRIRRPGPLGTPVRVQPVSPPPDTGGG